MVILIDSVKCEFSMLKDYKKNIIFFGNKFCPHGKLYTAYKKTELLKMSILTDFHIKTIHIGHNRYEFQRENETIL